MMSSRKIFLTLLAVALSSGFFWSSKVIGRQPFSGGDDYYYSYAAQNLLESGKLAHNEKESVALADPVYPLFVAGIYGIFGVENFDAVRIAQILLFALTALLVYSIVKNTFGAGKKAFVAGLLFALFFPLAGYAGRLLREVLFSFLVVFSVWSLLRAQTVKKFGWFVLAGLSLGLLASANAIAQAFILFAIFGFFLIFGREFFSGKILARILVMAACFAVLGIGFSWKYHWTSGTDPVASRLGATLSRKAEMIENMSGDFFFRNLGGQLFGYYFFEKDGFDPHAFLNHRRSTAKSLALAAAGLSPKEQNEIFFKDSSSVIIHNIPSYFAVSLLDFLQFNGPMLPNPDTFDAAPMQNLFIKGSHPGIPIFFKVIILLALRIAYWLFFVLVIWGLARALKDWRRFVWPILAVIYFNIAYVAIFGIPRYSASIYAFYFIFFAVGLAAVWKKYRKDFSGLMKHPGIN